MGKSAITLRDQSAELRALQILNDLAVAIASELNLQGLVQKVVDAGVSLTDADFGAFFYNTVDERGEALALYVLAGAKPEDFASFAQLRATPVFAPTFNGEGVVRPDDITADLRYGQWAPHHGMPKGHLPVRSYLAVPVKGRTGEVIGGLFFDTHPRCVFPLTTNA